MHDLDTTTASSTTPVSTTPIDTSGVMGAFSIDDDDDDDDIEGHVMVNDPLQHHLQTNGEEEEEGSFGGVSVRPSSSTTQGDVEDHPLSAVQLSNSAPTAGGTTQGGNPMQHFFSGATMSSMHTHMNQMGHNLNSANAPSMENITKKTTMFASNLASMAQRGIAQVAAATAPVTPVHVVGGPSNMNGMAHQSSGNHSFGVSTPIYPPNAVSVTASGIPTNQPIAGSSSSHELDKEQKTALVNEHVGELLPGERIIMFLSNLLHVSDTSGASFVASQSQDGTMWCCVMTYYRLVLFSTSKRNGKVEPPPGWDPQCWPDPPSSCTKLLEMPLASMDRVEKMVYQAAGSSYMGLVVYGKDCGRIIRFTTPSYADTGRAFESLNTYAFPGRRNLGYLFAFESKRNQVMASVKLDEATGQQTITLPPTPRRFDPMTEYPRLLQATSITQSPWALWASVNGSYALSGSYPSVLVGPASLDETKPESLNVIRQCAAFRSEQRLPSMTWCGVGGSSIWRSSQPKVGLQGNRSSADELYMRHISESARGANAMAEPPPVYPRSILQQLTGDATRDWVPEPGCGLKILDLRPRSSAMANRTGGYGYENTSNYSNTTLQFCNVQNIHAVRDSYQKLCSVCNSESTADVSWNSLVEDTKWLGHVRTILASAWETAYWVHVWRMPVLVHCSHGWDRTSQTVALAQLLLDPYYRTRHGFGVLVEKDFMSFGHPFHLRSAHGEGRSDVKTNAQSSNNDEGQISPIFLQFLDCVYQIVQLYPNAFEFNTKYLLEFSFQIYSCRFGNMLCDTEREREVLAGIRQRTYSVWDYLEENPEYVNKDYKESEGVILMPLPTLLRNIHLWKERHCCFSPKPTTMLQLSNGGRDAEKTNQSQTS
jgi:myotubularin-related protein 1/2